VLLRAGAVRTFTDLTALPADLTALVSARQR
jgi:hypothetical protein